MTNRIESLCQAMPQGVDGVLVVSAQNRYYFTGMRSTAGTLLVTRDASYFIIDFRYIELAKRTVQSAQVILQDKLGTQLQELVQRHGLKTLGLETSYMTVGEKVQIAGWLPDVTLLETDEVDKVILKLRSKKDESELAYIKEAQKITDDCFAHILNFIRPGVTERAIAVEMLNRMMSQGADGLAFDTICISGVNTSLPHGKPTDKKVEAGDFVTMDFGAAYAGYCSDMTRTVAVGHVTDEMRKVYDTVLEAQLRSIAAITPTSDCSEIDAVARNLIYGAGYEGCFGHSLGHCVGLDIHESPRFASNYHENCYPGMVITVEPGIYLEGKFGCRIEDMVYIRQDSVEDLTHSPKELLVL